MPINWFLSCSLIPSVWSNLYKKRLYFSSLSLSCCAFISVRYALTVWMSSVIGLIFSRIIASAVSGFIFRIRFWRVLWISLIFSTPSFVISIWFSAKIRTASRFACVFSRFSSFKMSSVLASTAFLSESPRSLRTSVPTALYSCPACSNCCLNALPFCAKSAIVITSFSAFSLTTAPIDTSGAYLISCSARLTCITVW